MYTISTHFGDFYIYWKDSKIHRILFPDQSLSACDFASDAVEHRFMDELSLWFDDIFAGHARALPDSISIDYSSYGDFVRKVLEITEKIPPGHVWTYRDVAVAAGCPRGARAVGNALGSNRTPLVIPCHRVVRTDKTIGGFTGGVFWKERFLKLEHSNIEGEE